LGHFVVNDPDAPRTSNEFAIGARAREKRGLSRSQLARKVEVVDTYISRIETGRAQPSFRLILAIAHQLGITAAELLDNVG
jgi:ribosome-binding protein aMBF1 (putative translation factor)